VLRLQDDGNLTLFRLETGEQLWSSGVTAPAAKLGFGQDGNLVVFSDLPVRHPVWWSNNGSCRTYEWLPGQTIRPGDYWVTCTGAMFAMQASDGNVLRVNSNGQVVWATNTAAPLGRMEFRASDGRLVVYNSAGQEVWTSTVAAPAGKLILESNGTLSLLDSTGIRIWTAGTP
jgi:hypothetical protein